jgi:hypothetical protein
MMADLTGAYTTPVPTISQNTAAVIKYRSNYASGTQFINIPITTGLRNIITSVYTTGNKITIGFGEVADTITDERFTFTITAGPLDLSNFFGNAPFSQYKDTDLLIIETEAATVVTVAFVEFKG